MTAVASRDQLYPLARSITEIGAPWVVNIVSSLVLGFGFGAPGMGVIAALATGGLPMMLILVGMRLSHIGDHHVTERRERHLLVVLILVLVGVAWAVLAALGAPAELVGFTGAAFVTLLVIGCITAGLRWKISVHTAVLAGAAAILAFALSPWWLLGLVAIPVVGWSRVHLGDHTVAQVSVGALVGLPTAAVTYLLLV